MSQQYPYQSITIHPPDCNGAREVWAEWKETFADDTYDTEGIIGWLYYLPNTWVWMNEAGHPTRVFSIGEDIDIEYLTQWFHTLSPMVTWSETART